MSFKCTSCGLCCKGLSTALIGGAQMDWMKPAVDAFPYKALPDGSCEKLVDNKCSVYENRPLMCNLNQAAKELDMPYTKKEWFDLNYVGCAILIREEAA